MRPDVFVPGVEQNTLQGRTSFSGPQVTQDLRGHHSAPLLELQEKPRERSHCEIAEPLEVLRRPETGELGGVVEGASEDLSRALGSDAGQSTGGDVVLSETVANDPAVREVIADAPSHRETVALKGFTEPVGFVRLTPDRAMLPDRASSSDAPR